MKITTDIADDYLGQLKTLLDGGFLYVFNGPIPESAEDALDMGSDHTQLAMLSVDGDNMTGLTWETPANGVMLKPNGDTWEGLNDFDGANDGESSLEATFARLCPSGDDGRSAASTPRLQFCISGPAGFCELMLSSTTVVDNAVLKTRVDFARIVQPLG